MDVESYQLSLFPSMRPRWRCILVNSKDMSRIGELGQARQRKCDILLNKPGSGSFQYPMDAEYAAEIHPYKTGVLFERFNWRATVARRLAGQYGQVWDSIWSGYVLPISEDVTNNRMMISCVGWLQRLAKRVVRDNVTTYWGDVDDIEWISHLLYQATRSPNSFRVFGAGVNSVVAADGFTLRWPAGSVPNNSVWIKDGTPVPGAVPGTPNEGPGGSTTYVPGTLRRYSLDKYQYIWPEIERTINLENGCDINLDPLTRELTYHRRYRRVKDDVVVGFQWGPQNIAQFGRELDGERKVNYVLATGEPGTTPQYAHSDADMLEVGPIEEVHPLGGVRNNNTLLAFAGAELLVRQNGVITYGITPHVYTPESGVPEPFVDYRVGDQIRATAYHAPRVAINSQACRVFGMSVSIDDNDNEQLGQLQLSP